MNCYIHYKITTYIVITTKQFVLLNIDTYIIKNFSKPYCIGNKGEKLNIITN